MPPNMGLGVFELPAETAAAEQREFLPIVRWVQGEQAAEETPSSNVVSITAARALSHSGAFERPSNSI